MHITELLSIEQKNLPKVSRPNLIIICTTELQKTVQKLSKTKFTLSNFWLIKHLEGRFLQFLIYHILKYSIVCDQVNLTKTLNTIIFPPDFHYHNVSRNV